MKPCPTCGAPMQQRTGKFGDFLFCPYQQECGQKTITVSSAPDVIPADCHEPHERIIENRMRQDPLYNEACFLESSLSGMASVAYENERDHERSRNTGVVDGHDVLFCGGMFCDMGMEDDDEDFRPW